MSEATRSHHTEEGMPAPDLELVPPVSASEISSGPPPPEENVWLARDFIDLLESSDDYRETRSEIERRPLRAFMAQSYIMGKVQRVVPLSQQRVLVTSHHLHNSIEHFFIKNPPHLPQTPERVAAQNKYLDGGIERALDFVKHPEIFATHKLLTEADSIGHDKVADAARILLASYGRAIATRAGIGRHANSAIILE